MTIGPTIIAALNPVRYVARPERLVSASDYAALAPLLEQYRLEMEGHAAFHFAHVPLDKWVADIVRARQGVATEDPEALADWLER